ncbi:MAG: ChbG/HpnK family deacetylase [Anaerolineales bacterium]
MKRLIVNSDDYGRSPEISRGIRDVHLNGIVTSTTCMMNIRTTARDVAIALNETPDLKMGVHLNLTAKRPILPQQWVQTITDENGDFFKPDVFFANLAKFDILEVKAEWRAQIESYIAAANTKPTHLDSHHHSSFSSPALFKAMLELAREYDCAIRYPITPSSSAGDFTETARCSPELFEEFKPHRPENFIATFYDESATLEHLLEILNNLPEGTSELMCHPGYVDNEFAEKIDLQLQTQRRARYPHRPRRQASHPNKWHSINFVC